MLLLDPNSLPSSSAIAKPYTTYNLSPAVVAYKLSNSRFDALSAYFEAINLSFAILYVKVSPNESTRKFVYMIPPFTRPISPIKTANFLFLPSIIWVSIDFPIVAFDFVHFVPSYIRLAGTFIVPFEPNVTTIFLPTWIAFEYALPSGKLFAEYHFLDAVEYFITVFEKLSSSSVPPIK